MQNYRTPQKTAVMRRHGIYASFYRGQWWVVTVRDNRLSDVKHRRCSDVQHQSGYSAFERHWISWSKDWKARTPDAPSRRADGGCGGGNFAQEGRPKWMGWSPSTPPPSRWPHPATLRQAGGQYRFLQ
nr:hypothetical protein [Morganella morganii]